MPPMEYWRGQRCIIDTDLNVTVDEGRTNYLEESMHYIVSLFLNVYCFCWQLQAAFILKTNQPWVDIGPCAPCEESHPAHHAVVSISDEPSPYSAVTLSYNNI